MEYTTVVLLFKSFVEIKRLNLGHKLIIHSCSAKRRGSVQGNGICLRQTIFSDLTKKKQMLRNETKITSGHELVETFGVGVTLKRMITVHLFFFKFFTLKTV